MKGLTVSVDFGPNATAVVLGFPYENPPRYVACRVYALGPIPSGMEAVRVMRRVFDVLPPCDVYLLEEQPKRNSATSMMEAAFSAFASTVADSLVLHVPVSRVRNEFELPRGDRGAKKKAAVTMMHRYLDSVRVSPKFTEYVDRLKRVHDIADAFLQLLWFARRGRHETMAFRHESLSAVRRIRRTSDPARRTMMAERLRQEKRAERQRAATRALYRKTKRRGVGLLP
jgi:hypothetical protein